MKIWDYLDGKKTNIGQWIIVLTLALTNLGMVETSQAVTDLWERLSSPEFLGMVTGTVTMVVGLIHRFIKESSRGKGK